MAQTNILLEAGTNELEIVEFFLTLGPVSGLVMDTDDTTMRWNAHADADRYDVVMGELLSLLQSGGSYAGAIDLCVENDSVDLVAGHPAEPCVGCAVRA